jgi:hypothetical protein
LPWIALSVISVDGKGFWLFPLCEAPSKQRAEGFRGEPHGESDGIGHPLTAKQASTRLDIPFADLDHV